MADTAKHAIGPWEAVGNSWQYTTIYDASGSTVCRLDLEDWGVNEDNQEALEKRQTEVSRLISSAPDLLDFANRVSEACSFPENDFQRALRDEARRVIAKAEGRS